MNNVSIKPQEPASIDRARVRIGLLAKAANDIIWWADPHRGFTERQEAWEEFTGQTLEEYCNWGHVNAIHAEDRPRVQEAWALATAERRVCTCEYRVYSPAKGEYRHCLARGVPYLNEAGEIVEWVGVLSDIHDLKSAQTELSQFNRVLEDRVRERTAALGEAVDELERFTYTISHDLRQALRGILTNVHLVEEQHSEEDRALYRRRLRSNATQLHQLIEDLLKLARLSRREPALAEVSLTSLASEVVSQLLPRYEGRPFDIDIEADMRVIADRQLCRFVLEDLVDNAMKFSPIGGRIEMGLDREKDAFYVRDSGIGFEMAYAEKIFMPFERLHRVDQAPGTGIGLASVQRIVKRHHGKVWAESAPGKGATFFFSLRP